MTNVIKAACIGMSLLALTACNSGSSSSSNNDNDTAQISSLDRTFSASMNDKPIALDTATLNAELNSVFGNPNDEPIPVSTNDTLADVLNRAKSN